MYDATGRSEKDSVFNKNIALVNKIAYQLKAKLPANIEVDDLIQAGMIGLIDAIQRFEDIQQAQFETYATMRIRGAMLDELRNMDWLPRLVRENMRKIEKAIYELQRLNHAAPTEAEIAQHLDLSITDYQKFLAKNSGHQLLYIEDFQSQENGDHFLDRFQADDTDDPLAELIDQGFQSALFDSIESLPEREKLLMGLYYQEELNLKEIGAILGVTESRVSQIHSQAISRIRSTLKEQTWTGEV
ncbi:MAG: RNA polymerase sigma factor FliA [Methylococcaceae bacterium]|jgi:RNA polymerase sigma factor FliA